MVFLRSGDGPKFYGTLKGRGDQDVAFLEILGGQGADLVGGGDSGLDGSLEVLGDQGAVCVDLYGSHVGSDGLSGSHRVVDKVWHGVEADLVRNVQKDADLKPKSCVKNVFHIHGRKTAFQNPHF